MLSILLGWSTGIHWLQIGQASDLKYIDQWPVVCFDRVGEAHCEFYTFLERYMQYSIPSPCYSWKHWKAFTASGLT